MVMTASQIQAQYGSPVPYADGALECPSTYCVGGAVIMVFDANASNADPREPSAYDDDVRWPDQVHLLMVAAAERGISLSDSEVEELITISGCTDADRPDREDVQVSDAAWELFVAAGEVMKANDAGDVEGAWRHVDVLLSGRHDEDGVQTGSTEETIR